MKQLYKKVMAQIRKKHKIWYDFKYLMEKKFLLSWSKEHSSLAQKLTNSIQRKGTINLEYYMASIVNNVASYISNRKIFNLNINLYIKQRRISLLIHWRQVEKRRENKIQILYLYSTCWILFRTVPYISMYLLFQYFPEVYILSVFTWYT